MRVLLVLIVLVFPIAEIWGTVALTRAFGLWFLLYLVLAAALGIAIIRRERARMGPRMQALLRGGTAPLPALLYTFRRLAAGILLVLPGVLGDLIAIVLLLLPSRPEMPEAGVRRDRAMGEVMRGDAQVIEGEFREVDAANDPSTDASGPESPRI